MVHTRDLRHEPWRYRLRAFVSKPANLLLVFFLIVLVVLSLLPMATMSPIPLAAAVQVSRSVPKSYEPPTTA